MENKELKFPQLVLAVRGGSRIGYLERLSSYAGKPHVNLTFQKDNSDSRIIAIKYRVSGREKDNSILYYSERFNQNAIVTFNIGYTYQGSVLAKNYDNNNLGFDLEHLPKEGLRKKHIEKINQLEDIRKDLTPEHVANRYRNFFYSLQTFG
jgi:hypothetical protein